MIRYRFRFALEAGKDFINSIDVVKKILISNFELYTFSKKYKFSLGLALPFGWASESEYLDAFFIKREDDSYIRSVIEKNLPQGLKLLGFKTIPIHFPSIESSADVVEVMIKGDRSFSDMLFDSVFTDMIYDVVRGSMTISFFLYHKKTTREILKNLIELISIDGGIKSIVRKNIYWIDSNLKLRVF